MAEIERKIPEARVDNCKRKKATSQVTSTKRNSQHRRSWMSAFKRATQAVENQKDYNNTSPFVFPGEEEKEFYSKEIMHKAIRKSHKKREEEDMIEPMTPYNPSQYIVKCSSPSGLSPEHYDDVSSAETTNYGSVLDFVTKDMLDEWGKIDSGKQSPSFHAPDKDTLSQLIGYLWRKLDEKNEVLDKLRADESSYDHKA